MRTIDVDDAAVDLSGLIEAVNGGEVVLITKDGTAVARLMSAGVPSTSPRLGFLAGQAHIPDDFDALGRDVIVAAVQGDG
jgi:prevent-host-death family protein